MLSEVGDGWLEGKVDYIFKFFVLRFKSGINFVFKLNLY